MLKRPYDRVDVTDQDRGMRGYSEDELSRARFMGRLPPEDAETLRQDKEEKRRAG